MPSSIPSALVASRPSRGGHGAAAGMVTMELAKVCPKCGLRYDAAAAFCQKDGATLVGAAPAEAPDPRIGQVLLDQFRIEEAIGEGGMGAVYRARQTTLGRDVAIKILHGDLAQNPDAVRRFHREARISTSMDHPNVVRVFLFGQLPDGSLYLVMELLKGRTLSELLKAEPQLDFARALRIAISVCEGVGEAHAQGIVHRDVKPENVFLVPKGRDPDFVKVLDFGIARVFRQDEVQTQATQSGLVFGTARYISPEGAAGEPTDARSDVYSIGVLTYQLLCGETPFPPGQPMQLLMAHIHDRPPELRAMPGGHDVPPEIAEVVMRSLDKRPDARFEDASDLAMELRLAADRAGIDVRPRGPATGSHGLDEARRDPSRSVRREPSGDTRSMRGRRADPDEASLAGISSAGRSSRGWLLGVGAFLIGALAVIGIVVGVHTLRTPSAAEAHAALVSRGEAALGAHRYDGPDDDDLRSITDAMLAVRADDPDARSLRLRAADALVAEGRAEHAAGHDDLARARFELARTLVLGHAEATEALAELDRPALPARVAGLVIEPAPSARETVTLTATTPEGTLVAIGDRPRFVVRRDGRRLGRRIDAEPGTEPGTYTASYAFPSAGSYTVEFHAGDGDECFSTSTDVEVAATSTARPSHEASGGTGPVTTYGAGGAPSPAPPSTSTAPTPPPAPVITPVSEPTPPPAPTPAPPPDPPSRPTLPPAWTSSGG